MSLIARTSLTIAGAAVGAAIDGFLQWEKVSEGEREFNFDRFALVTLAGAGAGFFLPLLFRRGAVVVTEVAETTSAGATSSNIVQRLEDCRRNLIALEAQVADGGEFHRLLTQVRGLDRANGTVTAMERVGRRVGGIRRRFDQLNGSPTDEGLIEIFRQIRGANADIDTLAGQARARLNDARQVVVTGAGAAKANGVTGKATRRTIEELPVGNAARDLLDRCRASLTGLQDQLRQGGSLAAAEARVAALLRETADQPGRRGAAQRLKDRLDDLRQKIGALERRVEGIATAVRKPTEVRSPLEMIQRELAELESRVSETVRTLDSEIATIGRMAAGDRFVLLERFQAEVEARRRLAAVTGPSPVAAPAPATSAVSFDIMARDADHAGIASTLLSSPTTPIRLWTGSEGSSLVAVGWRSITWHLGSSRPHIRLRQDIAAAFRREGATASWATTLDRLDCTFPAVRHENLYHLLKNLANLLAGL